MQLIFDIYMVSKWVSIFPESDVPIYMYDFSYYYFNAARTILVVVLLTLFTRTSLKPFYLPFNTKLLAPSLEITLFTYFASGALIYLTFFPLAFAIPNFVDFWFIQLPPIVYVQDGTFLFWPIVLSFVSLAVLAPLTEELVFRGLLLQRWGSKYNSKIAILLSSAVFASMHTDPFGAFLFGVLMCYLAIRSRGILLPMVCHSLYNSFVWLISFVEHAVDPHITFTLADFKSEWGYGVGFMVISVVWAVRLQARIPNIETWKIPRLYR